MVVIVHNLIQSLLDQTVLDGDSSIQEANEINHIK